MVSERYCLIDFHIEMNKNNDKILKPLLIFNFWDFTLLFTTFFLQKGYFWAPLKMPTVPSSHCKRTDNSLKNLVFHYFYIFGIFDTP